MAKLKNFKGSVPISSGLCPIGGRGYPLVQAHDIQVDEDGTRLDAELEMLRAGSAAIYAGTVTTTDTGNGNVLGNLGVALSLTQGAAYKVTFNGIDYKCVGSKEDVYPYLGNAHFLDENREDTGEPFCLSFATNTTYLETAAAGSYTLAIYEETGGGLSVTEVSSPEEITADSPDGFYVVPGGGSGGSGESGGGGGTPIHYFDSLDAVPADLPEGSFVAVPSSGGGGGGFQMVEITLGVDTAEDGATLTAEKCVELDALKQAPMPIILKVIEPTDDAGNDEVMTIDCCSIVRIGDTQFIFAGLGYMVVCMGGVWILQRSTFAGDQNG